MRKTAVVTIETEGRDRGKAFVLTEMPTARSEKWAMRAFLAMARAGIDIPENIVNAGLAGIAAIGFKALGSMNFADAEPLMDEMLTCVKFLPNPQKPEIVRALIDDDIEEIATRFRLRKEVFALHTDFFDWADPFKSTSAAASQGSASPAT